MARERNERPPEAQERKRGVSRRGFLASMGTGALTVAAATEVAAAPGSDVLAADTQSKVTLSINGRTRELLVEPRWSLAYVLREQLGLSGTKIGCDRGECGACTVLINDRPRYACMTLAVEAAGAEVVTIEGLMEGEDLGTTQQAFAEHDAFQCGYCTPGQIMAAEGLVRGTTDPTLDEIRRNMSGNLCRCGAYAHIFQAVRSAAERKQAAGGGS